MTKPTVKLLEKVTHKHQLDNDYKTAVQNFTAILYHFRQFTTITSRLITLQLLDAVVQLI